MLTLDYLQMNTNENNSANFDNHNNSVKSGEDKQITSNADLSESITNSYFCFECGAIMTTKEDKKQHEKIESSIKTENMDDNH
jgi:hypothetical protein